MEIRVLAMIRRTAGDSREQYRHLAGTPSWALPLMEVVMENIPTMQLFSFYLCRQGVAPEMSNIFSANPRSVPWIIELDAFAFPWIGFDDFRAVGLDKAHSLGHPCVR